MDQPINDMFPETLAAVEAAKKAQEEAAQKAQEEAAAAKKAAAKKPATPQQRVVRYGSVEIPIDDAALSLEEIRARIQETFPELTKARTEMTYDAKTGIIVPVVTAAKKGAGR